MSSPKTSDPESEEKICYYEYLIRNRDKMSMTEIIKNLGEILEAKKRTEIAKFLYTLPRAHHADLIFGSGPNCSICGHKYGTYSYKDDSAVWLPCKHIMGIHCVTAWLQKHNSCPQCKKPLLAKVVVASHQWAQRFVSYANSFLVWQRIFNGDKSYAAFVRWAISDEPPHFSVSRLGACRVILQLESYVKTTDKGS